MRIGRISWWMALAVFLPGCEATQQGGAADAQAVARQAQVVVVAQRALPVTVTLPGTVVADQQVRVASRVTGYVRALSVAEGQAVRAGEPLLAIDPADVQGEVRRAGAGLDQAQAALDNAQAEERRFDALLQAQAVSRQQYEQVKLQYDLARARLDGARAALDTARAQTAYTEVLAPVAGVITQKLVSAGDLAMPGQALLMLENPATLEVQVAMPVSLRRDVHVGDRVRLGLEQGELTGRVKRVVGAADALTHRQRVRIALPAGSRAQSGDFVRVYFGTGSRQALLIPATALLQRGGIAGVFVVGADHLARYRMVRVGQVFGGQVEILAGLRVGEALVDRPVAAMQSGDRVVSRQ